MNKMPATAGREFTISNNMGPAISPYEIVNRSDFISSREALGYRLIDNWKNAELTCYIPFHPDEYVKAFDGFYFRRSETEAPVGGIS